LVQPICYLVIMQSQRERHNTSTARLGHARCNSAFLNIKKTVRPSNLHHSEWKQNRRTEANAIGNQGQGGRKQNGVYLELPQDETISLTSGSCSGSGSGAPKSSSYGSAKSVKSKRKKILLFQMGDGTVGVGWRRAYREKARPGARGT
jgi:hypothetical protein